MRTATHSLLDEIENFCRLSGMAESTFGRQAVNDGKLCSRLRSGKDVTLETAGKIRSFMQLHPGLRQVGGGAELIRAMPSAVPQTRATATNGAGAAPAAYFAQQNRASEPASSDSMVRPFRFYENRQKYLAFVNTCNEKRKVAERAARELSHIKPRPPALRVFDAGMGDGTVLAHLLRAMHSRFATMPFFVVGKEIGLEDVRLALEKLPDRFIEHPATVIVLTNLYYAEAPWLRPRDIHNAAALNWREVVLEGNSSYEYTEQLQGIESFLNDGWQVKFSEQTGNPMYVRPSVLVIYRKDHSFLLNDVIPRPGQVEGRYDLAVASQPWRARMSAEFKVSKVLAPLVRALGPAGRMLTVQSRGDDPALELVRKVWPEEDPFTVNRHELIKNLRQELGRDARNFNFLAGSDAKALFRYEMHTLPSEVERHIGTSTLFAAWNASIYVNQIEDERLEPVVSSGEYLGHTAEVLGKYQGLWFNDESFVVSRRE